ncbi:MAG: proline iminopeptidase-family hydrolase [Actinobacteria bacterium]|nr:proline iminopeptidase-family hydrolase [Actinomycetota bacterium]
MTESVMTWAQGDTWYRIVGDLDPSAAQVPVVVLHGGPGACHDYTIPIAELANRTGRAAVLYDQIGCGLSSHMPDQQADFWTVDLFKTELTELLKHLGIAGRYNLVGQSWGGMLGMDYAIDQPAGLNALGVCDSPARMDLWVSEANRLRAELPPGVDETLQRHEDAGTTESPEYQEAMQVFYDKHVCRVVPNPDFVTRSFAKLAEDPTVYYTMNGPSEFHCIGSLRTWNITDDLHRIAVPTLLVSGRYDEATPTIVGEIAERIPNNEWVIFEESSHMPHVEEPERFAEVLNAFLAAHD